MSALYIALFTVTMVIANSDESGKDVDIDSVNDAGKQFSWDSSEETSSQSYNGIVIKVYKENNLSPIITFGSELDSFQNIYCFQFLRVFESLNYNEIDGSSVDLSNQTCTINEEQK